MIELHRETYPYEALPYYEFQSTKEPEPYGEYVFNGWHKPIEPVTCDTYYQATYRFEPYENNDTNI